MTTLAQRHLEGFVDALGATGVSVLAPRRVDFLRAVVISPLHSIDDVYWAARVTLLSSVDQIEPFDRAFDAWFRDGWAGETLDLDEDLADESDSESPGTGAQDGSLAIELGEGAGQQASLDELLSNRVLADASAKERSLWVETVAAAATAIPRTRGRRLVRSRRAGTIDLRRVLGDSVRTGGEIARLRYRRRPRRMRRILLLLDVSGSLNLNSPDFLRFAHAIVHGVERVEVFTFGTRLTRITSNLRQPDLDDALASLTSIVADFDGGTRIGGAFDALLSNSRFLSFARGAVIIVLSDGLERGDPAVMAESTARLARLAHRLVWLTPMMGDPSYRPATRGMQAILGSLDRLGDASSGSTLLNELRHLPEIERRPRGRVATEWRNQLRVAS